PGTRKPRTAVATAPAPLTTILAATPRLIDVLPALHQHALDATGGSSVLLFEFNPRTGVMQATSGFDVEALVTEPWIGDTAESALVNSAFVRGGATAVARLAKDAPDLAERLGTRSALLIPLTQAKKRVGMVAVGFDAPPPAQATAAANEIAGEFLTTLELFRLRQQDELQGDFRELVDEVSASL